MTEIDRYGMGAVMDQALFHLDPYRNRQTALPLPTSALEGSSSTHAHERARAPSAHARAQAHAGPCTRAPMHITRRSCRPLHLSFDIDAVDPIYAPAT
jgi:hypothetical protein